MSSVSFACGAGDVVLTQFQARRLSIASAAAQCNWLVVIPPDATLPALGAALLGISSRSQQRRVPTDRAASVSAG
jgi:hypothetical protein